RRIIADCAAWLVPGARRPGLARIRHLPPDHGPGGGQVYAGDPHLYNSPVARGLFPRKPPTPGVTGEYTPAANTRSGVSLAALEPGSSTLTGKGSGHGGSGEAQPRNLSPGR